MTLVYAYGCEAPTEGLEYALAERERQTQLWDQLVEIDLAHDAFILETAMRESVDVAAMVNEIALLDRDIDELVSKRRSIRQAARSRVPTPDIDADLNFLFAARRDAYKERNAAMSAWRKANADRCKELEAQRYARIPKCKDSPLYWANYNSVMDRYKIGRKVARKKGRRLRPHDPSREDGVLTVQIQRTRSGLGAAPSELMDGAVSPLQIGHVDPRAWDNATPRGHRRRLCRTVMEMRIDRDGHMIRVPMWMDRALPDCRVKSAQLVWRREGSRVRWQLCLTITGEPTPASVQRAHSCGIDVGWRKDDDGLLVATLHDSRGRTERLYLPRRWMVLQDRVDSAARRLKVSASLAAAWARRFANDENLARAFKSGNYRQMHAAVMTSRVSRLIQWRRLHKRLLDVMDGTRAKQLRRRREIYRLWTHQIASRYGLIRYEQIDLARLAKVKRSETAEPEMPQKVRSQRQRAAIHSLLTELVHQAGKQGVLTEAIAGPSTMLCHACGEVTGQRDRASRRWECEHCGREWDQDVNAAINLCRADTSGEVLKVGTGR